MLFNSHQLGLNSSKKFNWLSNNWFAKETKYVYRFSTIFSFTMSIASPRKDESYCILVSCLAGVWSNNLFNECFGIRAFFGFFFGYFGFFGGPITEFDICFVI